MTSESGLELTLSSPRALRLPKKEPHVILNGAPLVLQAGRSEGSDHPTKQILRSSESESDGDSLRMTHNVRFPATFPRKFLAGRFVLKNGTQNDVTVGTRTDFVVTPSAGAAQAKSRTSKTASESQLS